MYKLNNCLITGGAGYLGLHVVKQLLKNKKTNIIIVDDFSTGSREGINKFKKKFPSRIKVINLDICKIEALDQIIKKRNIRHLIHLAAKTDASESFKNKNTYMKVNFIATKKLVNRCEKYKVANFIFASSAAVYGDVKNEKCLESQKLKPINPYGNSKKECEDVIKKLKTTNYCILRIFNMAGISKDLSEFFLKRKSIFFKLAYHLSKKKMRNFNIYKSKNSKNNLTTKRDFIHVEDVAKVIAECTRLEPKKRNFVINCGSGTSISIYYFFKKVTKFIQKKVPYIFRDHIKGDPKAVISNNLKLRKKFKKINFRFKDRIFTDCIRLAKLHAK